MRTRVWIAMLLCAALGCSALAQQAVVRVTSASAPEGETAKVRVTLVSSPQPVYDLQGVIVFNPAVMHIVAGSVTNLNGYQVVDNSAVANTLGQFRFAAYSTQSPIQEGHFFEFTVKAVGAAGSSSVLDLDVQVLRNQPGNDIPRTAQDGTFIVGAAVDVTVDFSWTPTSPLVNQSVTFTPTVTLDPEDPSLSVVLEWSFGDGTGLVIGQRAQAMTHTYTNAGAFTVTLTVKVEGVPFARTKTITVRGPQADFTWTPVSPTTQETVQFTDRSTTTAGTFKTWTWTMGDGKSYNVRNPTHKYGQRGTYTVTLTVTVEADGQTLTATRSRTVAVGNTPPIADFTWTPTNPKIGELVTLNAATSRDPDGTIAAFEWDFTGDGRTDNTGSTVQRAFQVGGTHMVKLTVTDNHGAQNSITKPVVVAVTQPTADFEINPLKPKVGETVTFNATGSKAPDGTIVLFAWDMTGDGQVNVTGATVTWVFRQAGDHRVTLQVTDSNGTIGVRTRTVPVQLTDGPPGDVPRPVADFSFEPEAPGIRKTITFTAGGSSHPNGTIVAYEWDFDNDGVYQAVGMTVTYTFQTGGSKIVTLRVRDARGVQDHASKTVVVQFVAPVADFVWTPAMPVVGGLVVFDGSPSTDPDGEVVFYEWDLTGDGKVDATGRQVNHVFRTGGTHSVRLAVTDNEGSRGVVVKSVLVAMQGLEPPQAQFSHTPVAPQVGDAVQFTDESTAEDGEIVAWEWDFGDGSTSDEQNPEHAYGATGEYVVTLIVTDNGGLSSAPAQKTVVVAEAPPPVVTVIRTTPVAPEQGSEVTLTATTTEPAGDPAIAWEWDPGDGSAVKAASAASVKHTFGVSGVLTVRVRARNARGGWGAWKTLDLYVRPAGGALIGTKLLDNPARTQARIQVFLPQGASGAKIQIFDMLGRTVRSGDVSGDQFTWDLKDDNGRVLADGIYFYLVTATVAGKVERSEVGRILVVR